MTWTITAYSPSDEVAVGQLQQLLWQGGPLGNARYLHWKYFRNPYLDGRYLVLAWEAGELVGMIGAFGARWEIPGADNTLLPCLADTVIAPGHRGTALFRQMLNVLTERLAVDGVPWLLDFGDQPAGPAMLMWGWKAIGPWAIASSSVRSAADSLCQEWTFDRSTTGRRSALPIDGSSMVDTGALANLIARTEPATRVRHVRDRVYFDWRFENPLASYYHLTAGKGQLQGYLAGHRAGAESVWGDTPTTIMDCEAVNDEIWADLIEQALEWLPGKEVLMWARDLSPARLALLERLSMTVKRASGRLTADIDLPNLLIFATGAPFANEALARLSDPSVWDLRSICGRSWR
ncbi:GNAT family N-acetyltransferase [Pseudomonas fluorescens]|uniref:GNAT family N-acetyltransferase n=1 Tax=Pseudomonas fluorescens TaxID=294 RepID=UPI000F499432|nr:GNAT family N-acetyltransferase [Pseudomonas fluorescens]RON88398.1 hypothetical protein BK668_15660 [Pseudomonas fluorescens]